MKDNLTVNSIFSKTIHKTNMRDVRDHELDARLGWEKLKAAHQDSSSGGRMFWLRKLILARMEEDDTEKHIERMNVMFERLNSLITAENPLTADNIYVTALLISLLTEWLPCVTHLLNRPHTTLLQIVTCLKSEATRRSSSHELNESSVVAARAYSHSQRTSSRLGHYNSPVPHRTAFKPDTTCSFCLSAGHNLPDCRTAQKVLAGHKRQILQGLQPSTGSSHDSTSSHRNPKAARTQTVSLGTYTNEGEGSAGEDETSDDSTPPTRVAVASTRPKQYARSTFVGQEQSPSTDWTVDSACSKTMAPSTEGVSNLTKNTTVINLADDSAITASHAGTICLPLVGSPHGQDVGGPKAS